MGVEEEAGGGVQAEFGKSVGGRDDEVGGS